MLYIYRMLNDNDDTFICDTQHLINTQSEKRLQYPDSRDYEFSLEKTRHHGEDTYAVINGYEMVMDFEQDKDKATSLLREYKVYGDKIKRRIEDRIRTHKSQNPDFYIPTYDEANFTHKLIYKGFKVKNSAKVFKPYDNWFGVSKYVPECVFIRGNKKIILSLQGAAITFSIDVSCLSEEIQELFKACAVKYIAFYDKINLQYETFSGELPDMEFIEAFIAN